MRSAFLAALDAIGSAAFLLSAGGKVLETNVAGKTELSVDARGVTGDLADAVRRGLSSRFDITRVSVTGASDAFLLVMRDEERGGVAARVARAAKLWMLSPRQAHVLALVAEGRSNKAIAAVLEIAERTVETHLTAIYDRAQVEGRSELLARVSRM